MQIVLILMIPYRNIQARYIYCLAGFFIWIIRRNSLYIFLGGIRGLASRQHHACLPDFRTTSGRWPSASCLMHQASKRIEASTHGSCLQAWKMFIEPLRLFPVFNVLQIAHGVPSCLKSWSRRQLPHAACHERLHFCCHREQGILKY